MIGQQHYDNLSKIAYRIALNKLSIVQDAEDIRQVTLLKYLTKYRGTKLENPSGTIVTIAKNACIDLMRTRKNARVIELQDYKMQNTIELDDGLYSNQLLLKKIVELIDTKTIDLGVFLKVCQVLSSLNIFLAKGLQKEEPFW